MHYRKKKSRELFRFSKGSLFIFCYLGQVSGAPIQTYAESERLYRASFLVPFYTGRKMYFQKNKAIFKKTYIFKKYCDIHIVN